MNIFAWIFGTKSQRDVKKMQPLIKAINDLEPAMQAMSDEELAAQTQKFREQLKNGAKLDDLLVPAFATVREAAWRVMKMRHYDVQLMGGIALYQGKIAEMQTGEGKTLVATLAAYLEALEGKGVHVITVNDYLAKRDAEWMGKIYKFLGVSVGSIVHEMDDPQRKEAYACDITYGTNNEFGFDYLRDNMKFRLEDRVQRGLNDAVVDEVDSILIDEARTPLIISGPAEESTEKYYAVDRVIPYLQKGEVINGDDPDLKECTGDYTVDEKMKTVELTEEGIVKVEKLLGIDNMYDPVNMETLHHVEAALKAHALYQRDKDYIVRDGEVIIVDEFTGRLMPGRRWSDGLHQAVEAKEHVRVQAENQTLATVTFQNYFRMYKKLSGMTGTAATEAGEFGNIYKLDVVQIPTNKKLLRKEFNDVVYTTEDGKFRAVAREAKALQEKGQPVLIGTVSVEKSEKLSAMLAEMGVKHEVLNAKNNEREAAIVAQAGRKGAVTVSTNMAGRGTDILLGGNPEFLARDYFIQKKRDPDAVPKEEYDAVLNDMKAQTKKEHDEVKDLGGLMVIGTERHESRRIDNQLRGRAGRQGDPGASRFYISLQDTLARVFGGDKLHAFMARLGMDEDTPIESKLVSKGIAGAQRGVEERNFEARKNLLDYDDVMNKQREVIYGMRDSLLNDDDQSDSILGMIDTTVEKSAGQFLPANTYPDAWDWNGFAFDVYKQFGVRIDTDKLRDMERKKIEETVADQLAAAFKDKEKMFEGGHIGHAEKMIMLSIIDNQWKDHLMGMDFLKQGIGLRGYAQLDPKLEYKKEAFEMFSSMMDRVQDETIRYVFRLTVDKPETAARHIFKAVAAEDLAKKAVEGLAAEEAASPAAAEFSAAAEPPKPGETAPVPAPAPVPAIVPPQPRKDGGPKAP